MEELVTAAQLKALKFGPVKITINQDAAGFFGAEIILTWCSNHVHLIHQVKQCTSTETTQSHILNVVDKKFKDNKMN
jgi:hypothetical protein